MPKYYRNIATQLIENLASQYLDHPKHGRWQVVNTKHGQERVGSRTADVSSQDWEKFHDRVVDKIYGRNVQDGEHLFHHPKSNIAAVVNVDRAKKQLRYITVLPHGKSTPRQGTKKFVMEHLILEQVNIMFPRDNWIDVTEE